MLTFAALALFADAGEPATPAGPRWPVLRSAVLAPLLALLRVAAVALFALALAAGWFGNQSPYRNLLPTMVWVVWWVGVAFVCALAGNVWAPLNPLRTLFAWAERAWARLAGGRRLSLALPPPRRLGTWPAVLLFFAFAWAELVWEQKDVPAALAAAVAGYAVGSSRVDLQACKLEYSIVSPK